MEDKFKYVVVDSLDTELQHKVDDFRQNNSRTDNCGVGGVDREEDLQEHVDKYCSNRNIAKWILVFDGEVVVGMAAVFFREIQFLGIFIKLGGVGKVRVSEDHRNLGIASKMMKEAMKQLHNVGASVALLCTNTESFLVDFYRKYGFELLCRPYKFVGKSGKEYVDEEGMIAPVDSKEIYNLIMQSGELLDIGLGNW